MRVARLALLLSACSFRVEGIDIRLEPDLAVADLAQQQDLRGFDLATVCDPQGADDSCSVDHSSVLRCRADGTGYDAVACAHGCGLGQGARCLNLEPSGAVQAGDYQTATATPTVTSNVVFNTDDGSVSGGLNRAAGSGLVSGIYYREVDQGAGAPKVGVFGFAALNVVTGVVIRASGRNAFALVSSGDVAIAGTIDVQACTLGPAVGGGSGGVAANGGGMGSGQAGSADAGGKSSGGGGAGHGDVGGGGGATMVSGGSAGLPFGQLVAEPLVLQGGGGGGAGGSGGPGGNGGGALQIAVNGTLTVKGTLHAGGCGGAAGGALGSGGGGGAGGTLLLEGAAVVLGGGAVLAANGGGGGAGGSGGSAGASATAGSTPASGGGGSAPGGSGGARGGTPGKTAPAGLKMAGGGGGAVGRIAIKTLAGTVDDQGAGWSPALSDLSASGVPPAVVVPAVFQ